MVDGNWSFVFGLMIWWVIMLIELCVIDVFSSLTLPTKMLFFLNVGEGGADA